MASYDRLSEALAGLALLQHPGLAGHFDRIFEQCALTSEDMARPHRSHICEKSSMPLTRIVLPTRPVPSQNLEHQGKLAHGFTWGYPPQPHHDFKEQVSNANTEKSCVSTARSAPPPERCLKAGARRVIPVADDPGHAPPRALDVGDVRLSDLAN